MIQQTYIIIYPRPTFCYYTILSEGSFGPHLLKNFYKEKQRLLRAISDPATESKTTQNHHNNLSHQ